MKEYNHQEIEKKWQKIWEEEKTFRAEDGSDKPKFYSLIEFPYPSGNGLHVGHVRSNTAMDAISRKKRMEGYNVLYPIGWDAFGLPTENYAIKTGIHPEKVTKENTDNFRVQLKKIGFAFDWDREINTTDPEYYKWTQWIFLRMFKAGLAYKKKMPINWCLFCKIGLANEEVVNGKCERCGGEVEKREKEQWMLAITKYADRLEKDLDEVDFLPQIKLQQKNWIGRSQGSLIRFALSQINADDDSRIDADVGKVEVFTTRPDTLFGVTYIVLAPESDYVEKLLNKVSNRDEILQYIGVSQKKTEIERTDAEKEKTGVKMKGIMAINPANNEEVPVYVADYVLSGYGTGAVMAVPAHDERDFEFATRYNLPIKEVIATQIDADKNADKRGLTKAFVDSGIMVNSGEFDGMKSEEAKWKITEFAGGKKTTTYKLRDWVFSRQRYWGEPIPIVHCESCENKKYQIVFLHGFRGDSKSGPNPWLKNELEKMGHTVIIPDLPNPNEPNVKEQANYVLENIKLTEDTILVGFSLSGGVLMRILEQTKIKIAKAIFLDAVLKPKFNDKERPLVEKADSWEFDFKEIKKKAEEFVILADKNYPVIKKEDLDELGRIFETPVILGDVGKDHFCSTKEPEILKLFENFGYIPLKDKDLPLKLPHVEKYEPTDTGESPLSVITDWVNVKCPKCGGKAKRETDTMPNWAGSSWYYLAYTMQGISNFEFSISNYKETFGHWLPVDWYNGGMEHVTLHLLYSRFWHKFLYDQGYVPTKEPYKKRTTHGLVLAGNGIKMSKSKGNVINPDEIVERFGADSLRLYEMFMGPFDQAIAWDTNGLVGVKRFLEKVWRVSNKVKTDIRVVGPVEILLHKTIKKVTEDIEEMRFNTAVSSLMILLNEMDKTDEVPKEFFGQFLILLSIFAPHISEELWQNLDFDKQIINQTWPKYMDDKIQDEEVVMAIQINGKVRGEIKINKDDTENEILEQILEMPEIKKWVGNQKIKKTIFIKGRLFSLVV